MKIGIPDKVLADWIKEEYYIKPADEGEAVAIGAGHYLATGERATVFMSADGFMNALCPLTSYIIPENIEMDFVIGTGRQEPQHKIATDILEKIIELLPYDPKRISFEFIRKQ